MSRTNADFLPTDREARICDLARRQLAALARDADALPERSIVRAWGQDFGGISIPNVQVGRRRLPDGQWEDYLRNAQNVPMTDLARLAGFSVPGDGRGRGTEAPKVVRTLAIHYLHRAGGGERTLGQAEALFGERVPWSDDRGERSYYYATLRRLRETYGLPSMVRPRTALTAKLTA